MSTTFVWRQVPFADLAGICVALRVQHSTQRPPLSLPAGYERLAPLISACWHHDPSQRPTMAECVELLTCEMSSIGAAEDFFV